MATYEEALRVEREGCDQAGKSDRLPAIDAELARISPPPPAKAPEVKHATRRAPKSAVVAD